MSIVRPPLRGVVIVSPGGVTRGGGTGSVTRVISEWNKTNDSGVRIDVLDPRGGGSVYWSLVRCLVAAVQLLVLRTFRHAGVIHLQVTERLSFPRKGIFFVLGRLLGMRTILHHHGAELIPTYSSASPMMRATMRWMVQNADLNIVLGAIWRTFLIERLGVAADRVVIHYNAVPDFGIDGEPGPTDRWKFLIAGDLSPRKGVSELLEAMQMLVRAGMPVSLTLAGGGQVTRYRDEAQALGVAHVCYFKGWVSREEMRQLFFSHGALILPSYNEGLPMAIVEALSARLPVITTPVGSIPEVLHDGVDCILVDPGSPTQIVTALTRIATDMELRERLVTNGHHAYEAYFDADRYMRRLLDLYTSLVSPVGVESRSRPRT